MDRRDELMKNYGISKENAEIISRTEWIRGYRYENAKMFLIIVETLGTMLGFSYMEAVDMKNFVEEWIN